MKIENLDFVEMSKFGRKKLSLRVSTTGSGTSDQCCDNNQTHFPMFMFDFHVFSDSLKMCPSI